jgi:hypothetical protein
MIDLPLSKISETFLRRVSLLLNSDVQRRELPQFVVRVAEHGAKRGIRRHVVQVMIKCRNR